MGLKIPLCPKGNYFYDYPAKSVQLMVESDIQDSIGLLVYLLMD